MSFSYAYRCGYVSSLNRYKPLINYTWSALPVTNEYVTNGVELWDDSQITVTTTDADNFSQKLGDNTYRVKTLTDTNDVKMYIPNTYGGKLKIVIDVLDISAGRLKLDDETLGSVHIDTLGLREIIFTPHDRSGTTTAEGVVSFYRGSNPCDVTFKVISVQKVIQEPNKRHLKDSGSNPKSPLALSSGRAVGLNGVDQHTDVDIEVSNLKSISFTTKGGTNNRILGRADWHTFVQINNNDMAIRFTGTTVYFNYQFDLDTYYSIMLTFTDSDCYLFVDGEYIESVSHDFTFSHNITQIGKVQSYYSSCTIKDLILFNQALTPQQIQQQYSNPEDFLYYEPVTNAGVTTWEAKSKFLDQATLDNIVAYIDAPLLGGNEKYVPEYESLELDNPLYEDYFTDDVDGYTTAGTNITLTHDSINGRISCSTTSGAAGFYITGDVSVETGKYYLLSIDSYSDGVEHGIRIGTGAVTDTYFLNTSETSDTKFRQIIKATSTTLSLYARTSAVGDTQWDNFIIQEISGLHEITNSTTANLVTNLPYGRQDALMKQDALGIMQGRSDYLECDSYNYLESDVSINNIGSEFMFELVFKRPHQTLNRYLLRGQDGSSGIQLDFSRTWSASEIRLYIFNSSSNSAVSTTVPNDGLVHICFKYTSGVLSVHKNGVFQTDTSIALDLNSNPILYDFNDENIDGQLRLFKVHTDLDKAPTPLELYNKAVAKGLLS